jgi:uncharacterized protein (DUF4415 family)
MSASTIKRVSLADIRRMKDAGELESALVAAEPETLGADFWDDAQVVEPRTPKSVHLKIDPEVFDFFKSRGKGHLTRMQEVLRAYVRAHQK